MNPSRTASDATLPDPMLMADRLPDDLPGDPFPVFKAWFDEARRQEITRNPDAMTVSTVDAQGRPSSRVVLCRKINLDEGHVTFFTNRQSRKGEEIAATGRVAALFHFDAFDKVVRMEGRAVESPDWESDEYFAGRAVAKRLGAWASDQSRPIDSRDALAEKVIETMSRFEVSIEDLEELDATAEGRERAALVIPRPPHWGGYRVWPEALELWVGNEARLHDRARYERTLTPTTGADGEASFTASEWSARRLQP